MNAAGSVVTSTLPGSAVVIISLFFLSLHREIVCVTRQPDDSSHLPSHCKLLQKRICSSDLGLAAKEILRKSPYMIDFMGIESQQILQGTTYAYRRLDTRL